MSLSHNDRRLIAALQRNARKSVSELSRELDLSRTTVQKRLAQLEQSGVIAGYHLKLGADHLQDTIQAYVNVVVQPRLSAEVARELERMPEVEALYTVSGKIDLIAIMRVDSPALLDHALDRLGSLEGVEDTDSSIILATKFDRR
jgi:DNA-binding Lrp family transcriptional regulator